LPTNIANQPPEQVLKYHQESLKLLNEIKTMYENDIKEQSDLHTDFIHIDNLLKNITYETFIKNITTIKELLNKYNINEYDNKINNLIKYYNEIQSDNITDDSLTTCLNMVKEANDKDTWVLNGGSIVGFYMNQKSQYKKLYNKYKTKYLQTKKH
jgi:hypothetical protein